MKKAIKLFSLLLVLMTISLSVQAGKRVGLVIMLDSNITHIYFGFPGFTNTYPIPYDLEAYCKETAQEVFISKYHIQEFVLLDKKIYKEYKQQERDLSKRKFKVFREEWIKRIKSENNIDGLLFIASSSLDYYPGLSSIKADGLGLYSQDLYGRNTVYIPLLLHLFWGSTPQILTGKYQIKSIKDFPFIISKKKRLSNDLLMQLEDPLKNLIKLQLIDIKKTYYL